MGVGLAAGEHLAAIWTHLQFFFAALFRGNCFPRAPQRKLSRQRTTFTAAAAANADVRRGTIPVGIILPHGARKERWDMLIMMLILYSAAAVPLRICFDARAEGAMWYLEVGMSLTFIIDVILAFNTALDQDGVWIYDRCLIARAYMLGWVWIDCPSALPVELLELLLDACHSGVPDESIERLATLRFLRLFRLFRLLRLLKFKEYITKVEETFMVNLRILKLLEIFVKLGFIAHMLGCGWYYMHTLADGEPSWVSEYDNGSALEGSLHKKCATPPAPWEPTLSRWDPSLRAVMTWQGPLFALLGPHHNEHRRLR